MQYILKVENMHDTIKSWSAFQRDKRAVTAIEYGLVGVLIAVAVVAGVTLMGANVNSTFNNIATAVQ